MTEEFEKLIEKLEEAKVPMAELAQITGKEETAGWDVLCGININLEDRSCFNKLCGPNVQCGPGRGNECPGNWGACGPTLNPGLLITCNPGNK